MTTPTPAPAAACWSCQQNVNPSAEQCLWCGAARPGEGQSGGAIPSALPPGMAGATAAPSPLAPASLTPAQATPAAPSGAVATAHALAPTGTAPAAATPSLSPAFRGHVAGTGARLAAFTIDVAATLAVVGIVWALTASPIFTAVALVECVVFLWILEARTGLSVGNALLRIRVSRADGPFSPGVGRSAARFAMTGVGFFVGVAGAWVIVASSAWDGQRQRRGWADVATRTLAVTPPQAQREGRLPGMVATAQHQAPRVDHAPQTGAAPTTSVPGAIERPAQVALDYEDSHSASRTIPPAEEHVRVAIPAPGEGPASGAPASPALQQPTPALPPEPAPTPVAVPSDHGMGATSGYGDLLLVFDTGQREQVALPAGIVLGRNPSPIEPDDHAIVVGDPEKTVSRTHLRIEHSRGRTWVTDNASANGTHLLDDTGHSTKLVPHERTEVEDGMRVRIGERAFSINALTNGPAGGMN